MMADSSDEAGPADPSVRLEVREHVLLIVLNRPHAMNAIDRHITAALGDMLEQADRDPQIWAVVVTGAGERAFCAGADLKELSRGETYRSLDKRRMAWGFAGYVRHTISKPTIAAVNGLAYGGGLEIALASDLIVAADTARFGLPEARRGVVANGGGAFRLPRQIPRKVGMEMLLTGAPIDTRRALALGLVNRVVPADRVVEEACALADIICGNAPLAVQASKRIALGIMDGVVVDEEDDWRRSIDETRRIMRTSDAQEGPRAFAEKRQPRWAAK